MMKNKIGCVVIIKPNHNNYGTFLQGYATTKVLDKFGYEYDIIRYNKKRILTEKIKVAPFFLISGGTRVVERMIGKKIHCFFHKSYARNLAVRTRVINEFKKKYFQDRSVFYNGYKELCEGSLNYKVVMIGSDQVWTPMSLYSKFYNLLFVDERVPKFSYASSFGVSKLPSWQIRQTKEYLDKFDLIGVREVAGKAIVDSISSKKATVVVDPTLLLTKQEWESCIEKEFEIKEPYIFCYILGKRPEIRTLITELKEKTGLKVVFLRHVDEYIASDNTFGDYAPYDLSPLDFLSLIKNAAYVCTDSFHGTIFSILFRKQFMTFYRINPSSSKSTHSRIDSLFTQLGLESRLYQQDIYKEMTTPVDYEAVEEKLIKLRGASLEFFKEGLELKK